MAESKKELEGTNSRPQFGGRILRNEDDVFKHNAWDNVEWGEKQEKEALEAVQKNSEITLTAEQLNTAERDSALNWDKFYSIHQNRFFKNRNWLFTEFPELAPHLADKFPIKINPEDSKDNKTSERDKDTLNPLSSVSTECEVNGKPTTVELETQVSESSQELEKFLGSDASYRIFEIGCGVGNAIFPVLEMNDDKNLFMYGADFSSTAIDIIKKHPDYNTQRSNVFVLNVSEEEWTVPFPINSLDVITSIYLLSAIHPTKHANVVKQIFKYLKPGGVILFRDYGRYDLAQLRFKKGKCIADNCYLRGDGTKSYFFTQDEVRELFSKAGFEEKQNIVDRRLQVNRGKQLTMHRVWLQAKYVKPMIK